MKFLIDLSSSRKADEKFFPQFQKYARSILKELGFKSGALSILLVRNKKMIELNWKMMKHKGPTDVLSFSYLEKKGKVRLTSKLLTASPPTFLGEIIICLDTALRNAKEYDTCFEYECALYLCHGTLHCLGFDDQTTKGFQEMQSKQDQILNVIFPVRSKVLGSQLWGANIRSSR